MWILLMVAISTADVQWTSPKNLKSVAATKDPV
jgi:hypothetical protein